MRNHLNRFIVFFILSAIALYSLWSLNPPKTSFGPNQPGEFSVQSVYSFLQKIAKEPHPTGSMGNDRVREYIIEKTKSLGYVPVVQKSMISSSAENKNLITSAAIQNILIRISGSSPSNTLLVTAHYV